MEMIMPTFVVFLYFSSKEFWSEVPTIIVYCLRLLREGVIELRFQDWRVKSSFLS